MAYRVLTDIYVIMRANVSRHHDQSSSYFDNDNQFVSDKTNLVDKKYSFSNMPLPPEWVEEVEEVQFEFSKINSKLKELSALHDKHLNRPTFDDNADEEQLINSSTQSLTQMLNKCQTKVRKLANRTTVNKIASSELRLIKNVINNLATSLQQLTQTFRQGQNAYLKKIQSRKERSNMLFDTSQYQTQSNSAIMTEDDDFNFINNNFLQQEQIQMQRINQDLISERELEINHIVQSIQDLNDLFKDIATMVVDQGSVLDRIDCNIEMMSHSVEHGLIELQKASKHQKTSRKIYIITVLAFIFLFLFILLIITKS